MSLAGLDVTMDEQNFIFFREDSPGVTFFPFLLFDVTDTDTGKTQQRNKDMVHWEAAFLEERRRPLNNVHPVSFILLT